MVIAFTMIYYYNIYLSWLSQLYYCTILNLTRKAFAISSQLVPNITNLPI